MEPEDFYKRIRQKIEEEGEKPAYDPRLWEQVKQKMPAQRPWWLRLWPAWLAMAVIAMQLGTWWYFEQKWEQQQTTIEEYRRELERQTNAIASHTSSRSPKVIRDTVYITQYIQQRRMTKTPHSNRNPSYGQEQASRYSSPFKGSLGNTAINQDGKNDFAEENASTQGNGSSNKPSSTSGHGGNQQEPPISSLNAQATTEGMPVPERLPVWGQLGDSIITPNPWPPQKRAVFQNERKVSKLQQWIQSWQFEALATSGVYAGKWGERNMKRKPGVNLGLGWQFAPRWRLRAGLGLSRLYTSIDEDDLEEFSEEELQQFPQPIYSNGELPEDLDAKLWGLEFPISLQYLIRPQKKVGGFVGIGLTGQMPLHTQIEYAYEDPNDDDEHQYVEHPLNEGQGQFYWTDARLSAGISYQLLPRLQVEASGYYGVALQPTSLYDWKFQPRGLRLGVVWQWP